MVVNKKIQELLDKERDAVLKPSKQEIQEARMWIVSSVEAHIESAVALMGMLALDQEWKDAIVNPLQSALQATKNVKTGNPDLMWKEE